MTEKIIEGPWRATILWNSIIRSLREELPLKKHRRNMRTYDNCFTGLEAIDWLHKHLKKNPNFDGDVTRDQAVKLLQKLIKARVVEPVLQSTGSIISSKSSKMTGTVFAVAAPVLSADSLTSSLFRLSDPDVATLNTPRKQPSLRRPRPKLLSTSDSTMMRSPFTNVNCEGGNSSVTARDQCYKTFWLYRQIFRNSFRKTKKRGNASASNTEDQTENETAENEEVDENSASNSNYTLKDRHSINMSYLQSLPPNSLVVLDENDQTWREVFVSQLCSTLSDAHVKTLNINLSYIIYNMTNVSSRGVVQLTADKNNDLPRWCLSAMKCLANWPLSSENSHFPNYRGFEMDVFSVIKDYFVGLRIPLCTYELFDIFVSAFIKAEVIGAQPPRSSFSFRRPRSDSRYTETDLDNVYTSTPSCIQSDFYTMQANDFRLVSSQRERLARVRHTLDVMPSMSSQSSLSTSLSPELSATAIMRNFLPPNTCFETAFMYENPITRIVPQKCVETLSLQRSGRPICFTPISSVGSIRSAQWDSRSIATQTSQDEDESAATTSTRSRQPRWKRTTRFRKSIAVMETGIIDCQPPAQSRSTGALVSRAKQDDVQLRKGFSSVDNLLSTNDGTNNFMTSTNADDLKLLQRFNDLCSGDESEFERRRRSFSGKLEILSTPKVVSDRPKKSPPDNMILSKTVRKEKRKQRHKREMSNDRTCDEEDETSPTSKTSRVTYLTSQYRDLTVKTPFSVAPSDEMIRRRAVTSSMDVEMRNRNPSLTSHYHPMTFHQQPMTSSNAIAFVDPSSQTMQRVRAEPFYPFVSSLPGQPHQITSQHTQLAMSQDGIRSAIDSFKLIGLLIPPCNRRKLQLLLKFMRRVSEKQNLELDATTRNCRQVVVEAFCETILKPQDLSNYDEELSRKIVNFFIDHYDDIWTPPVSLRREVEERVYQSLVSKRMEAGEDPYPITFCERVPSRVYEEEKKSGAETALADLLEHILSDPKMNQREKKKKLLKFKDAYPIIWRRRFPDSDSLPEYLKDSGSSGSKERFPSLTRLKNAMRI